MIEQRTGPVSCKVRLEDGRIRRCHQDQVRSRFMEMPPESPTEFDTTTTPATVLSEPSTTSAESPTTTSGAASETDKPSNMPPETTDAGTNNPPTETART